MTLIATLVGGGVAAGTDDLGKVVGTATGGVTKTVASAGLSAIASWVLGGTKSALEEVAQAIGSATAPDLTATWFSGTYWRVAGLAAILTVPFVFAAALQALLRSDPGLLAKVVFVYLPVSLLAVSLAAPITMLLLGATDQMCDAVSATALTSGAQFLTQTAAVAGGLSAVAGSPFLAVAVGLLTVAAALTLAIELLIREAAVYVVVLMLPLAFAAFVWPARRIWAVRMVELLISLILSKFVIVAVLSLAGSAFGSSGDSGVPRLLTAMALLMLSTFAPWTLMRMLPFTELAAGAAGALRHELPQIGHRAAAVTAMAEPAIGDLAAALPASLRRQADAAGQSAGHGDEPLPDMSFWPTAERQSGASVPAAGEPAPGVGVAAGASAEAEPPARRDPFPEIDPDLHFNLGPGDHWLKEEE